MTDQHAGIVCSCDQLNRAKGSREGTSSRFILPCRVQGQRPCWGQGAKPLGSSNALVTRTAAGGIAANPDKSAQGCRTLPIASCRLRRAAQSCNQTQGDGSHPHTQARRRQSAEHTEAPSSGCASIPPAHSESAAQHPSSAHFAAQNLPALRLHLANNRNIHPQKARRGSRRSASAAAARARFLVRRNLPIRVTARRNADELQSPVRILRQTADVQRHTRAALPLPPAGEDSRQ